LAKTREEVVSERKILLGYLVDIFGPMAAWWVTRRLGFSEFWGLALGIVIAGVSTGVNTFRRRQVDAVGVLVLLEMATSIVLLFWLHSPRMLLIRPSFYSGIAALYLMGSAFAARPLSLEGSKPMATKGDPVRTVAWERAWEESPQFRLAHRLLTFGNGVAFLADAILRVVVVFRFPIDRAAWLSNLPHITAAAILIVLWALFGRWAGGMVDGIQQRLALQSVNPYEGRGLSRAAPSRGQ
jgi:hypothetical protein